MKLFKKKYYADLIPYLQEMVDTRGLMSYFLDGLYGTKSRVVYNCTCKEDKYEIRFAAWQSALLKEKYFSIQIFFKSGESFTLQTKDLYFQDDWKGKIKFNKPEINGASLYEAAVQQAAEHIIINHKPDMIDSMKAIIKGYHIEQTSKAEKFRGKGA